MLGDEVESCFSIKFEARLSGWDGITFSISTIFDHENVGVEVLYHLEGIWQAQSNVSSISMKEDNGRKCLWLFVVT